MINVIIPPTFLYRKLIELRNLKFEVFWPYDIERILLCFSVIREIGRKTISFRKFDCVTGIPLSTSFMNTVKDNRQASQAFKTEHFCHIFYTKILLNVFQADRYGINCSGCISEHLRNVAKNPSASAERDSALATSSIWEPHPPHPLKEINTYAFWILFW